MGEKVLALGPGVRIWSPLPLASWLWEDSGASLSLGFPVRAMKGVMPISRATVSLKEVKRLRAEGT